MKIDLHLHTPISTKNGDTIKWFSIYDTLKRIMNNHIKLAAFTDHNAFDLKLYKEAKKLAATANIVLLPGVEINVVRKCGIIGHMLVLFDQNLNDDQLEILNKKINSILKSGISINHINDWFSEFLTIRIIHIGKNDFFEIEDLDNLNYDAFEITNYNHPNYLKVLKSGYKSSIVAFSDTHIWNEYPQHHSLYTDIDSLKKPDFNELKKQLSLNLDFVKEF